ncbi:sporulation protein [Actinomadura xylanilytica]|uniref:sporulation protein n=1 Tax=Actinomadura xylanilytica TaxID=887459 RepID=UPI00255B2B2E|nr:sporulation protein [Actinomadura xylanilytica]MDL4772623.1 sporulation protein [Actinomadura xylanilytica]
MSYGQMGGYGAAGPSVDAILAEPNCRPGGVVSGKVHLRGGDRPLDIRHVTLALMPRMQTGHGGESAGPEVYRGALTRPFRLDAGTDHALPFSIPLPYELPFTTVLGRELPGFTIGLCTEVDVQGRPDPGDVDRISVEPLDSQQWVLTAIARLGFRIQNVTFESRTLRGVAQRLPFHQEIHLVPPPAFQGRLDQVGLSFVASPNTMAFVLRAEDRSAPSDESFGVFQSGHKEAGETDWNAKIGRWLEAAAALPPAPSHHAAPPPHPGGPPPGGPPPQAGPPQAGPLPHPGQSFHGGPPPPEGQGAFPPPAPPPAPGGPPPYSYGAPPAPYPHGAPPAYGGIPPAPPAAPPAAYPPAAYPPAAYPPTAYPPAPIGHPAPPPPVHVHHTGPPAHYGHHGHGWAGGAAAAGVVGGVAAVGIAGGLAAGAMGHAAGEAVGFAGDVASDVAGGMAGDFAGDVAGDIAGGAADVLGGLLGGLFG